jgi:hypothetical protein
MLLPSVGPGPLQVAKTEFFRRNDLYFKGLKITLFQGSVSVVLFLAGSTTYNTPYTHTKNVTSELVFIFTNFAT